MNKPASLFLLLACFCLKAGPRDGEEPKPISVVDFRGKTLVFPTPVKRIVCCIESSLSCLYMLGVQNTVVAVPASVYRESAAPLYAAMDDRIKSHGLPSPGNWDFVNIETIVALKPDLVIVWSQQKESIASLEQKGIPVYGVFLSSFNDVYKEVNDFGLITGTARRAGYLANFTRNEIKRIETLSARQNGNRTSVYFMWAQGPLETSGTRSTVNELLELSGAVNVCRSPREHLSVNPETVLGWDPEVIVMWQNPKKSPEDILSMSMWRSLSAIRNHRVYELPSVFHCDFWTLKFQYAVKRVAAWCYPDRFNTFDLERECRTMLDTLYGPIGPRIPADK